MQTTPPAPVSAPQPILQQPPPPPGIPYSIKTKTSLHISLQNNTTMEQKSCLTFPSLVTPRSPLALKQRTWSIQAYRRSLD
jgi:hypothetical protein